MSTKANSPKKRLRTDSFISYSGETAAELFSYPARGQYDVLVPAFREGIQRKAAQDGEPALSSKEQIVLAVTTLFEEVNNGGYDLRNDDLRAIKGAMAKECKERDDALGESDRSFYKLQRGAARKIYPFWKANRSHIVF